MVAPVTSTIRSLPSEVVVGPDEGLRHDSAINLDHVQTVEQRQLHRYVDSLNPIRMRSVCRVLAIGRGCGGVGSTQPV